MIRSAARRIMGMVTAILLLSALSGCSRQEPEEKVVIRILYSNNFKRVEELVESVYDDIDLQIEISPYSSEQLRRLDRGVGPELVISPQPDSNLVKKYLLDISDTKASAAYDGTIMNALKLEGKTYLLPLPGVYSGYIVNETLFERAGLAMPANNTELVSALAELKEKGLGLGEDNIIFSIMSDYNTSVGMFYVGYMVPDFLGTVEGMKWLADFTDKKAAFTGVWEKSFALSDALVEAGVMDPEAISLQRNSILCHQRLVKGTLAAAFGDSALYYECVADNRKAAEEGTAEAYTYRMYPLLSDEGNEPWFLFSPSALLGVNNAISEEKQNACRRILELLSTPEGQEALQAIDRFYCEGTDESSYDFSVIGTVSRDLLLENFNVRFMETELGNFIADCVAEASGAPIAVVNGGGIRASFYQGVVYGGDIAVVCPFDNQVVVLEMDGQTLWDMLENGLSTCTEEFPGGRFLQVSGLNYIFDSSKPAGNRLVSVTLPDGKALDRNASYQVAVTDYMAGARSYAEGNGDGYTMLNLYDDSVPKGSVTLIKETGLLYRDALALYFERHRDTAVDVQLEGRITDLAQEK
ncbi:extracellular solute-binding protein [Eisenbergiella tayi]|uniref:Trifunctional nucleotide phosphoesterase protein YfkN n=1 Tax=Eisenbergiella tayi TaxID=1432052 RepID=A0A1E3AE78_9FIRM|nr:extracellular solute-binding protein [Eisenbergiella tayi]ODM06979.1 Trifunctional nucleotide phosphoesterase protein YfkN precursor [Eisenbergiella tayi]